MIGSCSMETKYAIIVNEKFIIKWVIIENRIKCDGANLVEQWVYVDGLRML